MNKYSSNLAVLSETGRFPMYFSIILSIVKYLYRLENLNDGLLKQEYELAKELHGKGIQTWYTSALYILDLLNHNILARENRVCRFCNMNAIENEFHFLINCSFYNAARSELFCKINIFNVNHTYLNIL